MKVIDAPAASGFSWIKQSFRMFIARPGAWIALTSTWMLASMLSFLVPLIGPAVTIMLQPVLFAGLVQAARDQDAGQPFTVGHLLGGFRFNGRALVSIGSIALLAEILVMILLDALGFPRTPFSANGLPDMQAFVKLMEGKEWLLFVGFVLVVMIKAVLWFATPLLALNPMRAGHAIRWSFYALIANFLPVMLFGAAMLGVFFLAAMPWGLGLLAAIPVYALAHYVSYRQVFPAE